MTIQDLFDKGGIVVWVLAGYSLLALFIVLERYFNFWRMGRATEAASLRELVEVARGRGPEAAVARTLIAAAEEGGKDLARVAERVQSREIQRMEWGLRTLGVLGNTAPLLGLLGTITGMIKAFMVIEAAGGKVDAQALAGGIWEAMVTTGVGLVVAIPILIFLHFLEAAVERRAHSMHRTAGLLLERRGDEEEVAPGRWEGLTDAA